MTKNTLVKHELKVLVVVVGGGAG